MSQAYTPGLLVSPKTKISKVRELPLLGKSLFKVGDHVRFDQPVLSAEIPGEVEIVRIADRTGLDPELIKENVKVHVMGYKEHLPAHTQKAVERAIDQTKMNTGMVLNFALNYGSRAEIITAVQEIASEVKENQLAVDGISEEVLAKHLMTGFLPIELRDPSLVIRTSGEERISNFLLWQIAYSEFFFTKAFWPDFNDKLLEEAIAIYQHRDRRFGGVKEEKK